MLCSADATDLAKVHPRVQGVGFRVHGPELKVQGSGFRAQGQGARGIFVCAADTKRWSFACAPDQAMLFGCEMTSNRCIWVCVDPETLRFGSSIFLA